MAKSIVFHYSPVKIAGVEQHEILTEFGTAYIRADCLNVHYADAMEHSPDLPDECMMNAHPAPSDEDRPKKRWLFLRTWTPTVQELGQDADSVYVFVTAADEFDALIAGSRDTEVLMMCEGRGDLFAYDHVVEIPPAKVLVTVSGGVAEPLHGADVECEVVDYDNIDEGGGEPASLDPEWQEWFNTVLTEEQRGELGDYVSFSE